MTIKSIRTGWNGISALAGNDQWFSDFESIASVTVGASGVADVTFSSIPSTYTHLQLRYIARGSGTTLDVYGEFNGDSASNYRSHYLTGDGSTASSGDIGAQGFFNAGYVSGSNQTADRFGVSIIDILDYTNTNKFTTTRTLTGWDNNGSGQIVLYSGLWRNTNAINSIKLYRPLSSNWIQYSHFALYGIRG